MLRRAKRKFEEKLAEGIKKDSKSFHRYVKNKVGSKEKIGPLKDDNGDVLTDVESMGELLNRFFASVFSKEQGGGDRNVEEREDDQSKSKVQEFDTPQVSTVLRSNLMRLYSPVDLTGNLIMIEKLVSGGT